MYQIDNSSAAPAIPASTALGTVGFFTDGNPGTGTAPTIVPAEYLNMLMMEVLGVLSAANITPSKSNFTQLATAIKAVTQGGGPAFALDTGGANAYVCAFSPAITARVEGQTLRFKVKTTNNGASTFNDGLGVKPLIGGANVALQGGELLVNGDAWVQWNTSVGGGSYVLLFCTGAAEQVGTGTQTQHAVTLAQLNTAATFKTIASVVASRTIGVTYTNNTGRAILANVGLISTGTNQTCSMNINGTSFLGSSFPSTGSSIGGTFIIPAGATYVVPAGSYTLGSWTEIS